MNWSLGEKAKVSFSVSGKTNRKKITNTRYKRCQGMVFSTKARPLQRQGGLPSFWEGRVQDQTRGLKGVKQEKTLPHQQPLRDRNEGLGEPCSYATSLHILDVSPAPFLRVAFPQPCVFHLLTYPKVSVP